MNLTLNEYQDQAASTAIYRDKTGTEVLYPALGLGGEAGEVLEKVKKLIRDGDGIPNMSLETKRELAKELGDVLWYVAALAGDLDYSLDKIAEINLAKLFSRQERGVIGGSGDNR